MYATISDEMFFNGNISDFAKEDLEDLFTCFD
jgi:hypothetical protein